MINILQNGLDLLGFHPACPPDVYFGMKSILHVSRTLLKNFKLTIKDCYEKL